MLVPRTNTSNIVSFGSLRPLRLFVSFSSRSIRRARNSAIFVSRHAIYRHLVGSRDLSRIEVLGTPTALVRFDFRKLVNQQVTFLSDGGEDVRQVQQYLNPEAEYWMD